MENKMSKHVPVAIKLSQFDVQIVNKIYTKNKNDWKIRSLYTEWIFRAGEFSENVEIAKFQALTPW